MAFSGRALRLAREARLAKFLRRAGHDNLWSYLRAHPGVSLVDIAHDVGGDVSAIELKGHAFAYCAANGHLPELVRDLVLRGIRAELPRGWRAGSEFQRSQALFLFGFGEPYKSLIHELRRLMLEDSPPPRGWKPRTADDPVLVAAYGSAVAALPPKLRQLEARGQMIPEPGAAYGVAIEPYFETVSIYDGPAVFKRQLARVPQPMRHLLATHWCQSEVCNGGFHQLFGNSTGVLAPEAAAGFAAIGMPSVAAAVEEAMALLGKRYPRDRDRRQRALARLGDDDPFRALDDAFFKWLRKEARGFDHAADAWARAHADDDT